MKIKDWLKAISAGAFVILAFSGITFLVVLLIVKLIKFCWYL